MARMRGRLQCCHVLSVICEKERHYRWGSFSPSSFVYGCLRTMGHAQKEDVPWMRPRQQRGDHGVTDIHFSMSLWYLQGYQIHIWRFCFVWLGYCLVSKSVSLITISRSSFSFILMICQMADVSTNPNFNLCTTEANKTMLESISGRGNWNGSAAEFQVSNRQHSALHRALLADYIKYPVWQQIA